MTELKTLKDLNLHNCEATPYMILRQEAIKWIKDDREFAEGLREGFIEKGDIPRAFEMLIYRWIKRFNLTEEAIK